MTWLMASGTVSACSREEVASGQDRGFGRCAAITRMGDRPTVTGAVLHTYSNLDQLGTPETPTTYFLQLNIS